jgi:hypothetical protein
VSHQPPNHAAGEPTPPDDLDAALDTLLERLFTGSNLSPGCPSVIHVHLTEVDPSVNPSGDALKKDADVVNDLSRDAAQEAANMPAPEVVHTPDAISPDAVEISGLTTHVIDAVGLALEEQARNAREARAFIEEIYAGNDAAREAIERYQSAGGLVLDVARRQFYQAALKYHRFALGYSIAGSSAAIAAPMDARSFAINILAAAFVWGVTMANKK